MAGPSSRSRLNVWKNSPMSSSTASEKRIRSTAIPSSASRAGWISSAAGVPSGTIAWTTEAGSIGSARMWTYPSRVRQALVRTGVCPTCSRRSTTLSRERTTPSPPLLRGSRYGQRGMTRSSTTAGTVSLAAEDVYVHEKAAAGHDLLAAAEETPAWRSPRRSRRGPSQGDHGHTGRRPSRSGHREWDLPPPELDRAGLRAHRQRADRLRLDHLVLLHSLRLCHGFHPKGPSRPHSGLERLLVEAIPLDDRAPHALHGAVHRLVGLEDPALLARHHPVGVGRLEVLDVERRRHPGVLVLGLDAEGEDADLVHLALAEQEAQPAERQQAAVELRHHLVDVREGQRRPHDLVPLLGDER